jgi:hypothetical protein
VEGHNPPPGLSQARAGPERGPQRVTAGGQHAELDEHDEPRLPGRGAGFSQGDGGHGQGERPVGARAGPIDKDEAQEQQDGDEGETVDPQAPKQNKRKRGGRGRASADANNTRKQAQFVAGQTVQTEAEEQERP